MKNTLSFYLLIIYSTLFSQNPTIAWEKSVGGSSVNIAYSVIQTSDGGYVCAGYTASNDGDVSINKGNEDALLFKLNGSGQLQWVKTYGGSGFDYFYKIKGTKDGGFILIGTSTSSDGDLTSNKGSYDLWVVKTNSLGVLQWQKSFGGLGIEIGFDIIQNTDGTFFACGRSGSNGGDVTGYNGGSSDEWVLKFSITGNLIWQKCLGGLGLEAGREIIKTLDGNILVIGQADMNDGDVSGVHGSASQKSDAWLTKLDTTGALMWQLCYGGSDLEIGYSLAFTNDSGAVVCSWSSSIDGDVTNNKGYGDYWIFKVNKLGNIMWEKSYGGTFGENPYSISATSDKGFIVFGHSTSTDGDVSGNHSGTYDNWIIKLDSVGVLQWKKCLGGTSVEYGYYAKQAADNGYILVGGAMSSDGDVTVKKGVVDAWVVKLNAYVGMEDNSNNAKIYCFPNPANKYLSIKLENSEIRNYEIIDISGRIMSKGVLTNETISVENFQSGIYLLNIETESGKFFAKFIKE